LNLKKRARLPKPVIKIDCPCGSGALYQDCCEPYHLSTDAPNAEKLMRSRYSAYVLGLEEYLLNTWHPNTRPKYLNLANDRTKWLGLEVMCFEPNDEQAIVEFIARYKDNGKAEKLHEISQFRRIARRWYYVDGEFQE
jgi:SEC-C motif domain protein